MVAWILENLPFAPEPLCESLPEAVFEGVREEKNAFLGEASAWEDCFAQLLPGVLQMDGFFFAKFRRKMDADGNGSEN